jgi:hypothetical protein
LRRLITCAVEFDISGGYFHGGSGPHFDGMPRALMPAVPSHTDPSEHPHNYDRYLVRSKDIYVLLVKNIAIVSLYVFLHITGARWSLRGYVPPAHASSLYGSPVHVLYGTKPAHSAAACIRYVSRNTVCCHGCPCGVWQSLRLRSINGGPIRGLPCNSAQRSAHT